MAANDPIIGIDLGTSNSCVAMVDESGMPRVLSDEKNRKITPSVVSFHPKGDVLVGIEAKQRRVVDPTNTVFSAKRLIGRPFSSPEVQTSLEKSTVKIVAGPNDQTTVSTRAGKFAVPEVSAIILDHMRRIARFALKCEVKKAVITAPANFTDAQRQATATAGSIAELDVVRILNEPTAAALAYGHRRNLKQTVTVYDFGGGTFDVTLLELRDNVYEVIATAGDMFLGGDDIDTRLQEDMLEAFLQQHRIDLRDNDSAMQRLRGVAEQTKCQLSIKPRAVVKIEEITTGKSGAPLDLNFSVTREHFVERIHDVIDRSFSVCDEAFRLAATTAGQVDEVVLVGGTTRVPYLRDRVAAYFGRRPRIDVNPDEAVAMGAALQGAALSAALDPPKKTMFGMPAVRPPALPPPDAVNEAPLPPAPEVEPAPLGRIQTKQMPMSAPDVLEINSQADGAEDRAFSDYGIESDLLELDDGYNGNDPSFMSPLPALELVDNIDAAADMATVETIAPGNAAFETERPVLLDVTPRALGLATVGGFSEEIIPRNSQLPIEQTRVFTTAQHSQTAVAIRVCQGESRRFDENTQLGTLVLDDLPARMRGEGKIAVTFEINTDGILKVGAKDEQSGKMQEARIQVSGAQSETEVNAARDRLRDLLPDTAEASA